LTVGGCGSGGLLCDQVLRLGRIPANGELAAAIEEAGGMLPWDEIGPLAETIL
jgi:hypothetical protein